MAGIACGPELTEPGDTNVTGLWFSSDTVGGHDTLAVVYNIRLDLTQDGRGVISGSWSALVPVDAQCPPDLGCAPSDTVSGSNTVLQLHLELRGVGTFTGQVIAADAFRGRFARSGTSYLARFERLP